MLRLPTGPKERSADEMQYGRLGGGFSSYGRSGPSRDNDGGGGRRSYGGFNDEQRRGPPQSRVSEFDQPSRADEVDNWASVKKPLQNRYEQNRYDSSSLGGGGGSSRADEVDNWASVKRSVVPSFDSGGGRRSDRYGALGGGSRADEIDNWSAEKRPMPARSSPFGSGFRGGPGPENERERPSWGLSRDNDERERPRLKLDPPTNNNSDRNSNVGGGEVVRSNKANPFGAARPREEVLAEKGVDWKDLDVEIEAKKNATNSRPSSSSSMRPSSAQSNRSENAGLQSRPKVNPFGDAKPREVLLQERGQDYRKIDLELEQRGVDRFVMHYVVALFSDGDWIMAFWMMCWNILLAWRYYLHFALAFTVNMMLLSIEVW